jgi:hypothetical protein
MARPKLFVLRVSLEEMEGIRRLAAALHVTSSEALRIAAAEKLKRLTAKKAPAGTEAA